MTVTGTIPLGEVAFLPGPLRVTTVAQPLGATVAAGTSVLSGTSLTPGVQVWLPSAARRPARRRVLVTLPDGTTTVAGHGALRRQRGDVAGRAARAAVPAAHGRNGSGRGSSGGGSGSADVIPVTITIAVRDPRPGSTRRRSRCRSPSSAPTASSPSR